MSERQSPDQKGNRSVLILGAGASYATHKLPTANVALKKWQNTIRNDYKILDLALDTWVGKTWAEANLEDAWTRIDVAWKEREAKTPSIAIRDLTDPERRQVWKLAFEAKATERGGPRYYDPQIEWARDQGWSTEQFLSVAAGWELRKLIQQKFSAKIDCSSCTPYTRLINELKPTAIISFNYDTLIEQYLDIETHLWTYPTGHTGFRGISVLKPHGSVNWVHRTRGTLVIPDDIDFAIDLSPDEMGYQANRLVQNLVVGLRDKIEHTPAERSPAILSLFRNILSLCEDNLVAADDLWIVGYRFAPADKSFLDVVARSVSRRSKALSLNVIDKDCPAQHLDRVRELFGFPDTCEINYCFCGFEKWADHGFCRNHDAGKPNPR